MKATCALSALFFGLCLASLAGAQTIESAGADSAPKPTWTDPATGLMWSGKDNGSDVNWNQADAYCSNLHLSTYSDWRLPTIEELEGIYDGSVKARTVFDFGNAMVSVKGNLKLTGWHWSSSEGKTSGQVLIFNFAALPEEKKPYPFARDFSFSARALCVRPTDLSFEVATIKPVITDASHPFDPMHYWAHVYGGRASYWSMTLKALIAYAYGVQEFQVTGPAWTHIDLYDIEAKFPEGARQEDEKRMLQSLLKDRFKLSFQIGEKELETYALVVGKNGAKLKDSPPDPTRSETNAPLKTEKKSVEEGETEPMVSKNPDGSSTLDIGRRGTQTIKVDTENWTTHYERSKMTMEELAGRISGGCLDGSVRKVEDQTGIKGNYQVAWDCPLPGPKPRTSRDSADMMPSDAQDSGALSRSLDALGLKLKRSKSPTLVYVMDHVEKPSEN